MCQLVESIKLNDGKLFHLEFHNQRMNEARKNCFDLDSLIDLHQIISIPRDKKKGIYKCRVIYSPEIELIEFIPYISKKVVSLKLVFDDAIDYKFKYTNRNRLNALFEKRGNADDILIVKDGYITDSFSANPIFFDGKEWWTPDTVLLAGIQRAKLLSEGKIRSCSINASDLNKYQKVGLINAMLDMDNMPIITIQNIL